MNRMNGVNKNWFGSKQTVDTSDYSSVWFCGKLEFAVSFKGKNFLYVDVFSTRRWKTEPTRRETVGAFIFERTVDGWRPVQSSLHKSIQGKGIGPLVYVTLAQNGFPVCSGTSMSPGALKMWMRLCNTYEVLTKHKGKWFQITDVADPSELLNENKMVLWG
jgi:hypothetical protein